MKYILLILSLFFSSSVFAEVLCNNTIPHSDGVKDNPDYYVAEKPCLEATKGLMSRNGKALKLTIGRANSFLTDNFSACDKGDSNKCILHYLVAVYPQYKLFVTKVSRLGMVNYQLYDGRDGTKFEFEGFPTLAKDGRSLLLPSECSPNRLMDIEILDVKFTPYRTAFKQRKSAFCYDFVKFDGANKIVLSKYKPHDDVTKIKKQMVTLIKGNYGWSFSN